MSAKIEMSKDREEIMEALWTKKWFTGSAPVIQANLMTLPEKWNPFLKDLANRADVVGGITQLSIKSFVSDPGNFGGIVTFETLDLAGETKTYMYFSWRHARNSGAKGTIFVAHDGKIVGFVEVLAEKFALGGEECNDSVGGFGEPGEKMLETALRELKEELRADAVVTKIVDLGSYYVDPGMTNNCPTVFFAVVESSSLPAFGEGEGKDTAEVKSHFKVHPIGEYLEFIRTTKEGFSLAVFAKLIANGYGLAITAA